MKKKKLLTFAIAMFTMLGIANAQTEQGKVMIGGGFALSSADTDVEGADVEDSNLLINFTPKIGYFFTDNFSVGLGIEFTHEETTVGDNTVQGTDLIAGPYGRYYFPVGENSAFFGELDLLFGTLSGQELDQESSSTMVGFGVGPGFTVFSNETVGVEGLIRYNYVTGSMETGDTEFDLSISEIDFLVGIVFYL